MPNTLRSFLRCTWTQCTGLGCQLFTLLLIGLTGLAHIPAYADNNYFGIHGPSYHDGGHFNNANYGLYVVHQGFTGGFYVNSLNRDTFYLGYAREWDLPGIGKSTVNYVLHLSYEFRLK